MRTSMFLAVGIGQICMQVPALAAPLLEACAGATYATPAASPTANADEAGLFPVPSNQLGCVRGVSVRADANTTIWRCQVELAEGVEFRDGQPQAGFLVQRSNRIILELPDELMASAYHRFDAINVDLDQDGNREHILAAWNAESNGMGVHSWTIYVFDANWHLAKRFDNVSDWGRSSLVKAPASRRGCDLAITSFQDAPARAANSGGLVLRARFYGVIPRAGTQRTANLTIDEVRDRPTLERRYMRSLEKQRTTWFSREVGSWRGNVADWLNNPATVSRR